MGRKNLFVLVLGVLLLSVLSSFSLAESRTVDYQEINQGLTAITESMNSLEEDIDTTIQRDYGIGEAKKLQKEVYNIQKQIIELESKFEAPPVFSKGFVSREIAEIITKFADLKQKSRDLLAKLRIYTEQENKEAQIEALKNDLATLNQHYKDYNQQLIVLGNAVNTAITKQEDESVVQQLQETIQKQEASISADLEKAKTDYQLADYYKQTDLWYGFKTVIDIFTQDLTDLQNMIIKLENYLAQSKVDFDFDGVPNDQDNCMWEPNSDQKDTNGDGMGDVCDVDIDGIHNGDDNCLDVYNPDQLDDDYNGLGNACDSEYVDCFDSDGEDAYTKGYTTNGQKENIIYDHCEGDAVKEEMCVEGKQGFTYLFCKSGETCQDGACVEIVVPVDTDKDGIEDTKDNCPTVANADQKDTNEDGMGDACDSNLQKYEQLLTLYTIEYNTVDQLIEDSADQLQNSCSPGVQEFQKGMITSGIIRANNAYLSLTEVTLAAKSKGYTELADRIEALAHQFETLASATQSYLDSWKPADICITEVIDTDKDGIEDTKDNCPTVANPNQEDSDADRIGDACEISDCVDSDNGIDIHTKGSITVKGNTILDVCEGDLVKEQICTGEYGGFTLQMCPNGETCQEGACAERIRPPVDTDKDGIEDTKDNCPTVANADQKDTDADGVGDACEPIIPPTDTDKDGIEDSKDNCPIVANPLQEDTDKDGVGDACEPIVPPTDTDKDGIEDSKDNCPTVANPDQKDSDGDKVGDVCDPTPLPVDTFVTQYNELNAKLQGYGDDYVDYRKEYLKAKDKNDAKDIKKHKNELNDLTDSLDSLEEDVDDLINKVEHASGDYRQLLDNLDSLQEDITKLKGKIEKLLDQGSSSTGSTTVVQSKPVSVPSLKSNSPVEVHKLNFVLPAAPVTPPANTASEGEVMPLVVLGAGIVAVLAVIIFLLMLL
ncbi:MAG: thrombospondin type 3 repeat-containing protein [Candidatus Woesearchaeota archaeon]